MLIGEGTSSIANQRVRLSLPTTFTTTAYELRVRPFINRHGMTGFARAGPDNEPKLVQVYIAVLGPNQLAVKPRTLHKWMTEGRIAQEIISLLESQTDPEARPEWYEWLLVNHHWVLDGNMEASKIITDNLNNQVTRKGWWYSTGIRSSLSASEIVQLCESKSWSKHKMDCMRFSGMVVFACRPTPLERFWVPLGFCTETSLETGTHLFLLYHKLLPQCTFDEFVAIYESSGLLDLFEKYGVSLESTPKGFCEILSASPDNVPSVWGLKRWMITSAIPKAAFYDYGFRNCQSVKENEDLTEMYTRYFRSPSADPLALHRAFVQGRIFDHVSSSIQLMDKKYRRLTKRVWSNPSDPVSQELARRYDHVRNVVKESRNSNAPKA